MKSNPWIIGTAMLFSAALSRASFADELFREVKPNRCVALRQGQPCYQKILFKWSTHQSDELFCLYRDDIEEPLVCWQGKNLTQYFHDFESSDTRTYTLRANGNILDTTTVQVSWVYKSGKRVSTGWRLF